MAIFEIENVRQTKYACLKRCLCIPPIHPNEMFGQMIYFKYIWIIAELLLCRNENV